MTLMKLGVIEIDYFIIINYYYYYYLAPWFKEELSTYYGMNCISKKFPVLKS
jgi:hypothetical protein